MAELAILLPLRHVRKYHEGDVKILLKAFPLKLPPAHPVEADQALLITNSKLLSRK